MKRIELRSRSRRFAAIALVAGIGLAMATSLASHGQALLRAAGQLAPASLALALVLSVVHRAINAAGWGLVLRALGRPLGVLEGIRLWLASEACRWLPGSVWAYGSRTYLAARSGIPATTGAASLVLELLVTVGGWVSVACLGWTNLRAALVPVLSRIAFGHGVALATGGLIALAGTALALKISPSLLARFVRLASQFRSLIRLRIGLPSLLAAWLFYAAMAIFNGLIFLIVLQGTPGGMEVPAAVAISANAIAWLVGFFALFAPGGLIVREACLVALLSPWMPPEQALMAALAWRLTQILAELICFLGTVAFGLPGVQSGSPGTSAGARPGPHVAAARAE